MLKLVNFNFLCLLAIVAHIVRGASSSSSASAATASNSVLPAISIHGNKFFYPNGSQFYIKGVAYQADSANSTDDSSFVDPLADADSCKRDVKYLSAAYTNVIRVYAVNTSLDHSDCISTFADAGIYIIADLSEPGLSIDRDSPQWNIDLYKRYTSVVDMFSGYSNVLGFFAGNEVTNNNTNTDASPYVKAAIRDVKAYIKSKNYRDIPVGYSTNDDADTRVPMADYFACGDKDQSADFYGVNMYEWCGDSSFSASGYEDRTKEFQNMTIPVFFSEYGCNTQGTRKFTEVKALYGDDMTDVWSGGIVYMYFQEENDYGLVSVDGDSVKTLADYSNLKSELASVSPSSAKVGDVSTAGGTFACPATDSNWKAATSLPPTPDDSTCECLYNSLRCVIGDDVDSDDYSDLFSYICSEVSCTEINGNGTSGAYGKYSFCSAKDQLSYIMDAYYQKNGAHKSDCNFSGSATLKAATSGSCSVASAGSASGTATASGSKSSGTGSSSSSGASKKSLGNSISGSISFSKMEFAMISLLVTSFVGGVSFTLF